MQCPVCDKTFTTRLSVCPSCGSMTSQHNKPDAKIRFHSIEKITTADLQLEIGDAAAVEPEAAEQMHNALAHRFAQPQIETADNAFDYARRTRVLNSTLLEFPNKKTMKNEPEWRDEIKNRVRSRKNGTNADSSNQTATKTNRAQTGESANEQTEPALVINLKPRIQDHKSNQPNSIAARALERIERSRRQFETEIEPHKTLRDSNEQPREIEAPPSAPPLALVPSAPNNAPSKRRVLPMIEDDSIAAPVEEKNDQNAALREKIAPEKTVDNQERGKTNNGKNTFTVALNVPATAKKNQVQDLSRETALDAFDDLEDDESIAAAQNSVRKTVAAPALDEQLLAERDRSAEARRKNKQQNNDFAPLASRFFGGAIDFCVCAAATAALVYAFGLWNSLVASRDASVWKLLLVFASIKFAYLTASLVLSGTTIGARIFGLSTVAAEDGYIPTFKQAAANSGAYLLTLLLGGVGLATIFFSTERRALHDLIAGTVVVGDEE